VEGDFEITLADRSVVYRSSMYDAVGRKLFWSPSGEYEPETLNVLATLLRAGVFLDVGANTGIYSLFAAGFEGVVCHAFEPVPEVFAALQWNIAANALADRILARHSAVSSRSGVARLHVPDRNWSSATLNEQGFRGSTGHLVSVPCVSLDDFAVTKALGRVDAIKVDVEGSEDLVLAGAVNLLRRDRPAVICECLEETKTAEIEGLLNALGYVAFRIESKGLVSCQTLLPDPSGAPANYLFVPAESKSREREVR
jgi:FkbM family methyltransferase